MQSDFAVADRVDGLTWKPITPLESITVAEARKLNLTFLEEGIAYYESIPKNGEQKACLC